MNPLAYKDLILELAKEMEHKTVMVWKLYEKITFLTLFSYVSISNNMSKIVSKFHGSYPCMVFMDIDCT